MPSYGVYHLLQKNSLFLSIHSPYFENSLLCFIFAVNNSLYGNQNKPITSAGA